MKILNIRFKNLNSLVGEWEIDLLHPAFVSDGIFAITGPTGAGKSTILDAVCLALHGRTPRLAKVTKSENEIMSRRTGECFAEVTFETQAGRFRAHWSQRRARKKPTGELQGPKHEISNAATDELLETKIKDTLQRIETVTGMDFERFTRSMLLAQGDFAAFLRADQDERAPLLEQITGTEIYSRISMRVHERRGEEQSKLKDLQSELDGATPISANEEQQLIESRDRKVQEDEAFGEQITKTSAAIAHLEAMNRLEEELKSLAQLTETLETEAAAFTPKQIALDAAMRALELDADYASLTASRTEQQKEQAQLSARCSDLPALEASAKQAESALNMAIAHLGDKKREQENRMESIKGARASDLQIKERKSIIRAETEKIEALRKKHAALVEKQRQDSETLTQKRAALDPLNNELEASKSDGALVEELAGLRGRFEALKSLNGKWTETRRAASQSEKDVQAATRAWENQRVLLENETRSVEKAKSASDENEAARLETLEGKEISAWRKEQMELGARKELFDNAFSAASILRESRQAVKTLDSKKRELDGQLWSLSNTLAVQEERHASLEREAALLDNERTLLRRIESLEAERKSLADGEPCPLCGATEHPYAEGNIPVPDKTEARLAEVRESLKSVSRHISEKSIERATAQGTFDRIADERAVHMKKIEAAEQSLAESCTGLAVERCEDEALIEKLRVLHQKTVNRIKKGAEVLDAAETIDGQAAALRKILDNAKEAALQKERESQEAEHKKNVAEQSLARLKRDAEELEAEQAATLAKLRDEVRPFGAAVLEIDTLEAALDILSARRDRWVDGNNRKVTLEKEIGDLETRTGVQAEQIQNGADALEEQSSSQKTRVQEQEELIKKRREIFGDENPDDVETQLAEAVKSAEEAVDAARGKAAAANQAHAGVIADIERLNKRIGERESDLCRMNASFGGRISAAGFEDEAHYRDAALSEPERTDLQRQSKYLSDRRTQLSSKMQEKRERLAELQQEKRSEESPEELRAALETLEDRRKELQQDLGGIRLKLEENEQLKRRHKDRAVLIEAQQRECARWDALHELIGAADGKKYRNFAQGLTFEAMIGFANVQLTKMTDRYRLLRDDARPLELNVVDHYQAGEIRSAKNLSGGESFIVSLALALGLSRMAGRNVRVDSLFLDEGFGTLDDEALDTALATLSSLRQDGKLIGIISHVPALKERIGTQIQILPQPGGTGRIEGPGCRRVESSAVAPK